MNMKQEKNVGKIIGDSTTPDFGDSTTPLYVNKEETICKAKLLRNVYLYFFSMFLLVSVLLSSCTKSVFKTEIKLYQSTNSVVPLSVYIDHEYVGSIFEEYQDITCSNTQPGILTLKLTPGDHHFMIELIRGVSLYEGTLNVPRSKKECLTLDIDTLK